MYTLFKYLVDTFSNTAYSFEFRWNKIWFEECAGIECIENMLQFYLWIFFGKIVYSESTKNQVETWSLKVRNGSVHAGYRQWELWSLGIQAFSSKRHGQLLAVGSEKSSGEVIINKPKKLKELCKKQPQLYFLTVPLIVLQYKHLHGCKISLQILQQLAYY